jgi:hypothetical protein
MNYKDIKTFSERCDSHPDHKQGMISERDIQRRLNEEVEELREYVENGLAEGWIYEVENT